MLEHCLQPSLLSHLIFIRALCSRSCYHPHLLRRNGHQELTHSLKFTKLINGRLWILALLKRQICQNKTKHGTSFFFPFRRYFLLYLFYSLSLSNTAALWLDNLILFSLKSSCLNILPFVQGLSAFLLSKLLQFIFSPLPKSNLMETFC